MSTIPKPNEIYQHFKGSLYKIMAVAEDAETGADVVVYQALYGDYKVYVRELSSFMSKVDRNKYPDASQEYRFVLQEEETALEDALDPMLMEFLEADAYEEKLNILAGLHHRLTDDMINTMAVSLDVEINDGSIEERYAELKSCLLTFEKYERSRLY